MTADTLQCVISGLPTRVGESRYRSTWEEQIVTFWLLDDDKARFGASKLPNRCVKFNGEARKWMEAWFRLEIEVGVWPMSLRLPEMVGFWKFSSGWAIEVGLEIALLELWRGEDSRGWFRLNDWSNIGCRSWIGRGVGRGHWEEVKVPALEDWFSPLGVAKLHRVKFF